jgi:hypothetical protein
LATAGLAVYVILRLAYSAFYEPLGVNPEDLGFGYLEILAQAAVGFVGLVLAVGILLVLNAVLIYVNLKLWVAFAEVLWSLVRDVLSGLAGLIRHPGTRGDGDGPKGEDGYRESSSAEPSAGGPSVQHSASGALQPDASPKRRSPGEAGDGPSQRAAARPIAHAWRWRAGYISVVCVLIAAVLILQAVGDRRAVQSGEPRVPTVMGLRIASWGAQRATLKAVAENPRQELVALEALCLLYLGTHDGTVFLYEPRGHETLRVPAASVVVHIHESGTCRVGPSR